MNRAERRKKLREEKKNNNLNKNQLDFMEKFTPKVQKKIEWAINEVANQKLNEKLSELSFYIDSCMTAAMCIHTDFTYEKIEKIQNECMDLLEENTEKVEKLKNKFGEDWIMKINKQEDEVRIFCNDLIRKGIKQKEAVEMLLDNFQLSKAMLVNAFKKCKGEFKEMEELKKKSVDLEENKKIIEAVEYVWPEEKEVEAPAVENKNIIVEEKRIEEMNITLSIKEKLNNLVDKKDKIILEINDLEVSIDKLRNEKSKLEVKSDKIRQALTLLEEVNI